MVGEDRQLTKHVGMSNVLQIDHFCFFLLEPTEWLGDLLDAIMATDKRANDDTQLSLPPEPGCAPQGFPL